MKLMQCFEILKDIFCVAARERFESVYLSLLFIHPEFSLEDACFASQRSHLLFAESN